MAKSLEMPRLRRLLGETLERMRQGGVTITAASAIVGFCVRLRTDRIFVASHAYLTLACNSSRRAVDINRVCPTGTQFSPRRNDLISITPGEQAAVDYEIRTRDVVCLIG